MSYFIIESLSGMSPKLYGPAKIKQALEHGKKIITSSYYRYGKDTSQQVNCHFDQLVKQSKCCLYDGKLAIVEAKKI